MAKKRTSKSKSGISKKHGFFTKRKVLLGVAIIALAGVGIVFYSNAAVGDPPVEKTLYCNQGNCYETQVPGALRAPNKALVRETNKAACASTGKEWALKREAANKQANQWVCLKGNATTDPAPTVPAGFGSLATDCFNTVMPDGFTQQPNLIQVPGGVSNCLQVWSYTKTTGGSTVSGQFESTPMTIGGANTTPDNFVSAILADEQRAGSTIVTRNNNYQLDGQQSTFIKIRKSDGSINVRIVSGKQVQINGRPINGLVLTARNYGGSSASGRYTKEVTDQILANWQWTE